MKSEKTAPGKRKIKGNTICNECLNSVVMTAGVQPVVVYACSHQFHSSCLSAKQGLTGSKKCPICLKIDYVAIREEMEQRQ